MMVIKTKNYKILSGGLSEFISSGRVNYTEVIKGIYENINKQFGTDVKPPPGQ